MSNSEVIKRAMNSGVDYVAAVIGQPYFFVM